MEVMTESNYLYREYGISVYKIKSMSEFSTIVNAKTARKVIIVSNNPENWINSLNCLNEFEVFFILIGNENYEPKPYNDLNRINCLKHAFITLSPTKILNINILGGIAGNCLDGGMKKTEKDGSVYREGRIALSLKNKYKRISVRYNYSDLPLGYTNNFANKVSILANIPKGESLISNSSLEKIRSLRMQISAFSFLGQDSGRRREVFLSSLKKYKFVEILPFESGFGGNNLDTDFTYLKLLLNSEFILVPPGHLNNSNHRYTESLICGALPVILACNSLDPTQRDHWTIQLPFLIRYSAKRLVMFLTKIDPSDLISLKVSAEDKDFTKILEAKRHIQLLISK